MTNRVCLSPNPALGSPLLPVIATNAHLQMLNEVLLPAAAGRVQMLAA